MKSLSITAWVAVLLTAASLLLLAAFGSSLGEPVAAALAHAFSFVCHQIAERTFTVGGHPMLLCHRCLGVVAGFLAGAFLFPAAYRFDRSLWKYSRTLILLSLVPMAIDWGVQAAGLLQNTPLSRLMTGGVFGVVAMYFVARGIVPRRKKEATRSEESIGRGLEALPNRT